MNARWGGISIQVAHTQVQGMDAAAQIVRALKYFNERGEMQVIAILRGGGSADDLSCFNDEELTRAIAASKIPVITGIGHEVDESLADLAADVRASTPSNAAEMLVRDRKVESEKVKRAVIRAQQFALQQIEFARNENVEKMQKISRGVVMKFIEPMLGDVRQKMDNALGKIQQELGLKEANLKNQIRLIEALNPEKVLRQGYAILAGKMSPGSVVKITTYRQEIEAEIKQVKERK